MLVRSHHPRLLQPARWGTGKAVPFPVWFPLSVYALSQAISAAFIVAAAMVAAANPGASPAHPTGYRDLVTAWDGDWYRRVATSGYPSSLPLGVDGQVEQNAWAFSPGYPLLVRALMAVTRLDFSVVAPALSLILGAAAMVVIFALTERAVSRFYACAAVILTCTFMAAPVFQLAYSESLALLLLAGALLLLRERRYGAVAALLLLLALTRPVAIAFIPVVIAHGYSRWRGRSADPFPGRDRRALGSLAGWCIASAGLWPLIVGVRTGNILAWTKTQEAWRPTPHFGTGLGWPGSFLFHSGLPGLALLMIVVLLTLGMVLRRGAKAWGPELRTWAVGYPAYLLLATAPVPSVVRWLVLAFPLMWPFPESAKTRAEQTLRISLIAVMAVVGLALQWVWVSSFLAATGPSVRYP